MKINTNLAAINTNRAYNRNAGGLSTTIQRLSSGLRINSAKDDAAGLAISERFTSQIRGNSVGMRNAADAISMLQTAEGGLQEISTMIQRMRELAVQAANTAVIGASERRHLQKEVSQLTSEITRIAKETDFNGVNILNDGAMFGASAVGDKATVVQGLARAWLRESQDMITKYFGLTPNGDDMTIVLENNAKAGSVASVSASVAAGVGNITNLTMTIDMDFFTDTTFPGDGGYLDSGDAYDRIIAHEMVHAVMFDQTDTSGTNTQKWFMEGTAEFMMGGDDRVKSSAGGTSQALVDANVIAGNDITDGGGWPMASSGTSLQYAKAYLAVRYLHEIAGGYTDGAPETTGIGKIMADLNGGDSLDTAIANNTAFADADAFLADFDANGSTYLFANGLDLSNEDTGAIGGADSETTAYRDTENSALVPNTDVFEKNPTNFNVIFPFDPENDITSGYAQTIAFQVGANEGDTLRIGLASATAKALNIDNVDLVTDATAALSYFDTAIDVVAKQRARLGAQMNRVESAIRTGETTVENLSASRSRIVDADYAQETAKLTRTQILAQAGTAMQAQAQATSNLALNLLNGL